MQHRSGFAGKSARATQQFGMAEAVLKGFGYRRSGVARFGFRRCLAHERRVWRTGNRLAVNEIKNS